MCAYFTLARPVSHGYYYLQETLGNHLYHLETRELRYAREKCLEGDWVSQPIALLIRARAFLSMSTGFQRGLSFSHTIWIQLQLEFILMVKINT